MIKYLVVFEKGGRSPDNHLYFYRGSAENTSKKIIGTKVIKVSVNEVN